MTNKNMAFAYALSALSVFSIGAASAQDINANWFTHFEYDSSDAAETADREFEWGESALFLTGNSGRWSFLSEATFQAAHGLNRKFSGTGLGLSIVKQLLETMGSRLNVSSTVGKGTVFDFTLKFSLLPAGEALRSLSKEPEQVNDDAKEQKTFDILYVEDSETNQLVMSAMMERLGVNLALASSAREGFDALKATRFDVIITDIQMPEHSCLDLLQWIQESPGIPTSMRILPVQLTQVAMQ